MLLCLLFSIPYIFIFLTLKFFAIFTILCWVNQFGSGIMNSQWGQSSNGILLFPFLETKSELILQEDNSHYKVNQSCKIKTKKKLKWMADKICFTIQFWLIEEQKSWKNTKNAILILLKTTFIMSSHSCSFL